MVDRVNDYIENDLADDVIDPDGGVNTERKRARLGLPREEDAFKSFPTEGFEVGVAMLPAVGYSQVFKFLIEDMEVRQQLSVEKPIVKGFLQVWQSQECICESGEWSDLHKKPGHSILRQVWSTLYG